jgi:AcrR family transcriptional regulator
MASAAESKSKEKRLAILDRATRIFAREGYSNTDVQVIADAAGVGKGTVYRYFGNKADLFLAVADAGLTSLTQRVYAAIEGCSGAADVIRRASAAYGEFFQQQPELVEILIQERAAFRGSIPATHLVYRRKNRAFFEDIFRAAIQTGELRDTDVVAATDALANLLYGTVVCGCLEGSSNQLKEMAQDAAELVLQGLLPRPETLSQETGS